ncbi:LysM domain-containing protein [Dyella silvae]|uniref:LysM domain-containing protein n=1 Tax=Dyella silvae TaxID=2994424 RepID=UPI0022640229|nr:LysM domain-containing protein [Dyella silvae]
MSSVPNTSNSLMNLLAPLGLPAQAYPQNSRYYGVAAKQVTTEDGRTVTCLTRRVVPQPTAFATLQLVTVREGDRLDRLAAQYLGDPLLFWRLCDANGVLRPDELTDTAGETLRVTLPAGIPGATSA